MKKGVKIVERAFWEKDQEGQLHYNTGRGVGITVKKAGGHNNWMITVDGDINFAKKVHIKKNAISAAEAFENVLVEKAQEKAQETDTNA